MVADISINGITYSGIQKVKFLDPDNDTEYIFTLSDIINGEGTGETGETGGTTSKYSLHTEEMGSNGITLNSNVNGMSSVKLNIDNTAHVRIEISGNENQAWAHCFNLTNCLYGDTNVINNKPAWFTIPQGTVVFEVKNISLTIANSSTINQKAFAIREPNGSSSISNFTLRPNVIEDVSATVNLAQALSIGILFFFIEFQASTGDTIEFDVSMTVNGEKYI